MCAAHRQADVGQRGGGKVDGKEDSSQHNKCGRSAGGGTCVGVRLPQVLPRPTPRPQLSHGGTMGGGGCWVRGKGGEGAKMSLHPVTLVTRERSGLA